MKTYSTTLLFGVIAVLAWRVGVTSGAAPARPGRDAEPPPADPAPETTKTKTTTRRPAAAQRGTARWSPATTAATLLPAASDRNETVHRPAADRTGRVTTTAASGSTTPLTVSMRKATIMTTAQPQPTTTPPYSIYDMRYYMDEESLARETSSASASLMNPRYEAHTDTWRQFTGALTTPSVPYFDKMHSKVVTGIEHGIDQVLTARKQEVKLPEREEENTVEPIHYISSKPSDVRLDFSNRVEIIYNGTKDEASVRRDLVVINGTHLDLEINRTTVYPVEDFSTISYYEQTTPQEFHQALHSDNKEVITHPITTTDIPGATDAPTNNLRSHVDNSVSADSVQNEITTVPPGEINSTTNIFIIPETDRPEPTTELSDIVPSTIAFPLNDRTTQKPINFSTTLFSLQNVNENVREATEADNTNIITTTLTYETSFTTNRRPPWVPHQAEATTTALPEMKTVTVPRSGRGRMMASNASSSANSLRTSDAVSSGSDVELLTTESPEENTVYPLLKSSSPLLSVISSVTPTTRRKIYTFKSTPTTMKTTSVPPVSLPSSSSKSTEDNVITADRSKISSAGIDSSNSSAQNNERNEISSIYVFPRMTSRGTIKYTSRGVNSTGEVTTTTPMAAPRGLTTVKGPRQQFRTSQNTSTSPVIDEEGETSYIRVPTVEKPKNSSPKPLGSGANRTTSRTRFTPLGPTRIRTIAEDDRNSSEWPNSFSKIYVFTSTIFPPSYQTRDHVSPKEKETSQNATSVTSQVTHSPNSSMFGIMDHTSAEEITTYYSTPPAPDVTHFPVTVMEPQNISETPVTSTSSVPFLHTILFPANRTTVPSTTSNYSPAVLFTVKTSPALPVSTTPRLAATTEHEEATETFVTTTQMTESIVGRANETVVTPINATRANSATENANRTAAGVHSGGVEEDVHPNSSKPEDDLRHVEGGLVEEESGHHTEGNQLPDINQQHSSDGNHRGPSKGEAIHEESLPAFDDLDYGGGGIGGNDLETVAANSTAADSVGVTAKKDPVTTTSPSPVVTTTSNATGVAVLPKEKIPAYLLLLTDASWYEVCRLSDTFRTAVASMLLQASNKMVQPDQVILLNVSPALCSEVMLKTEASDKQLVPIEFYFTNNNSVFDLETCKEFRDVWQDRQLEYPYPVRSVELVSTACFGPNTTAIVTEDNSAGTVAAIVISCVGIVALVLLAVLVIVLMRKRQKRFNYGQRCTPVSLDAYSLDSVSVCNSVRRKAARASKRSYGNPAFDDPNAPTHPMNFAGLANFSSDVAALEEEFGMIPQLSPKVDEVPPGAETKNRYANVIPLPETRVTLKPVEGEPLSDYINANYVRGPKGVEKFYIACQAPLQTTITDFWRMVWENQTKVILMLTDLVEDGKEKCADYLPPSEVTDCHRLFGDFQITLKKREEKDKYIISVIQIKNLETNLWREMTHLWYLGWPAQGVPAEATSLIAFLIEARSYTKANTGPVVAHCSPGTGRTGTVLACDLCIRQFEQTRMVDIPRCVSRLRRDRAGSVQTKEQYVFIYQVLNIYATKLTGGALDSL